MYIKPYKTKSIVGETDEIARKTEHGQNFSVQNIMQFFFKRNTCSDFKDTFYKFLTMWSLSRRT